MSRPSGLKAKELKLKNQPYSNVPNLRKGSDADVAAGFTMVEIIATLAILSTSLLAVFGAMRVCSMASYHARMLTQSVFLAESLLTETILNKNIAFETTQGQQNVYTWQVQTAPTPVENLGAICVRVEWQEQQRQQQYELYSLIYIKPLIEGK